MILKNFSLTDAPHGLIRGDVYLPEDTRGAPVVVACHGFKGFKNWGFWPETGQRFAESGLVLVTFNVSGSGIGEDLETFSEVDAFEQNTIAKELDDLGRVLEGVTRRELPLAGADIRRLGLLGHSRGGGVALLRAGRDPRVRAVVTWAAVSTFRRWDPETVAAWRTQGFLEVANTRTGQVFHLGTALIDDIENHAEGYSPVAALSRSQAPTLVLHGTRDEAVPAEEASVLHRAAQPGLSQLALIPGAGHTFGATHPYRGTTPELDLVLKKSSDWFREHL